MILTCPSCGTQYVVKDGAIPPQGRQVRCAACKHSWHQEPEPAGELQLGPEAEADETAAEDEGVAEASLIDPSTGPEAEERAYEEAAIAEATADGEAAPVRDEAEASPGERWRRFAAALLRSSRSAGLARFPIVRSANASAFATAAPRG